MGPHTARVATHYAGHLRSQTQLAPACLHWCLRYFYFRTSIVNIVSLLVFLITAFTSTRSSFEHFSYVHLFDICVIIITLRPRASLSCFLVYDSRFALHFSHVADVELFRFSFSDAVAVARRIMRDRQATSVLTLSVDLFIAVFVLVVVLVANRSRPFCVHRARPLRVNAFRLQLANALGPLRLDGSAAVGPARPRNT